MMSCSGDRLAVLAPGMNLGRFPRYSILHRRPVAAKKFWKKVDTELQIGKIMEHLCDKNSPPRY